jgi:type VI secretion system secreted protein VgrG
VSQDVVELKLETKDFDTEHLRVHRLRARERMSVPYSIEVDIVALGSKAPPIEDLAGANVTVTLARGDIERKFHGVVKRAVERHARNDGHLGFMLDLVPHLWLASMVETLDVHLNKTVPMLIEEKLGLLDMHPGAEFGLSLVDSYETRQMMVQYRESDLDFIARWCEHYGVFYFFVPEAKGAMLLFGDNPGSYRKIADDHDVPFVGGGEHQGVYELAAEEQIIPRVFVCRDYNDQMPAMELQADHELDTGFGGGIIEYGANVETEKDAARIATIRAEEREATRVVYVGESNDPRFAAGHTFNLLHHPRHEKPMLIVEVEHRAAQDVAGWGEGNEVPYENSFRAIDAKNCFRPPRDTAIPRVHGVVAGIVETSQGNIKRDAQLDDQGRYTVRFLFDTAPEGERKASCPVRMMQPHAGPGYGMHFPLKPGIEVAIAFLDGNPDRPLIVGSVPNPITVTPITAETSTKNRIKTRSGILIEFEDSTRGT